LRVKLVEVLRKLEVWLFPVLLLDLLDELLELADDFRITVVDLNSQKNHHQLHFLGNKFGHPCIHIDLLGVLLALLRNFLLNSLQVSVSLLCVTMLQDVLCELKFEVDDFALLRFTRLQKLASLNKIASLTH
jgi:hypothetical protein